MRKRHLIIFTSVFLFCAQFGFGQTLKPGDGVKISFYNIEDSVKGNYFIMDNGNLHLPYIGMISSQNRDFSEIRTEIIDKYSTLYQNPEMNIQPLYRIDILGEVGKPGVYYLTGYESLADLIALAGGETNDSNIEDIVLLRNDSKLDIDLKAFITGRSNIGNVGIESGDKVYVPRTWWVGARDASILVSGVAVLVAIAGLFTK
jgi:polysaccharide export outer membrane protein